ncbi:MAG: flagellar basal-body MS-ring/collar protein FliF [Stenotrophomonas sp.]|uniref:flagellar basal-body MS-ring/collar protein FliF n=1 Tax=Stenotrophomonas sp. TaxID=69392 RepID=UPI003D6CB31D
MAGALFSCLLLVALAIYLALRPSYKPLFTDLKPGDASAVIAELEKERIPFRLDEDRGAILVPENDSRAARIKLMSGDLRLQNVVGLELFKDSSLGLTEFAQKVNYQRALQGELSRTIMSLDDVDTARVHLTLPESSIFRRDKARPKASIAVFMRRGGHLDEDTIGGIQRLVAAAVPEMAVSDVTVLDARGVALASANGAVEDQKFVLKRTLEEHYQNRILAQISHLTGDTQASVAVDAEMDFDQTQVTRESTSRPRSVGMTNLMSLPGIVEATGVDSTSGVRPPIPMEIDNGKSNRTVEQVVSAPGSVRRLSVGIVLGKPLSAAEAAEITELVSASIGLLPDRGDVISIIARSTPSLSDLESGNASATSITQSVQPIITEPVLAARQAAPSPSLSREPHSNQAYTRTYWLAGSVLLGLLLLVSARLLRRTSATSRRRQMSEEERQAFVQRLKNLIDAEAQHGRA